MNSTYALYAIAAVTLTGILLLLLALRFRKREHEKVLREVVPPQRPKPSLPPVPSSLVLPPKNVRQAGWSAPPISSFPTVGASSTPWEGMTPSTQDADEEERKRRARTDDDGASATLTAVMAISEALSDDKVTSNSSSTSADSGSTTSYDSGSSSSSDSSSGSSYDSGSSSSDFGGGGGDSGGGGASGSWD